MSEHCATQTDPTSPGYRTALWWALWINLAMFVIEVLASQESYSLALLADAVDFFGDAFNYGLSLAVIAVGGLWQSRAAMLKGLCMGAYGLGIWGVAIYRFQHPNLPQVDVMSATGLLALTANLAVAWMLYAYREGNANMRSVWLCTRNDAIGNLAVLAAAGLVWWLQATWPDLLVASLLATLSLHSAWQVVRQAKVELAAR